MVQEKEPKGITRRQFLKGITALGASALLSSCVVEEEPSPKQPTETPPPTEKVPPVQTPAKTEEPTAVPSPESTSTPEITRIVGLTITEEYLKNAFVGIGGEEMVEGEKEEISMIEFGQEYVSQSWGKEIDFKNLSEDPVASLKYLISLGAYQGQEGVYSPGKQGEEIIFPQLKDLSLPRLTLAKVPSEGEQKEQEFPQWVSPQGLLLRPDTQMTVVGLLNEPRSGAEVTVDKEAPGSELNSVLVAFTDYLRANENNIPRHYLAILPTHFPADPENKNTLSLQNLLEANGYQYDSQSKEIAVVDQNNQKTILGLNQIEGEELIKDLRQAAGLAFVDQMKGELIKNPLVPYYEEMPAIWEIKEETNEDGTISLLLQGQDEKGEMVVVAKASYDQEEEAWGWEKVEPTLELSEAPEIEGLKPYLEEGKIVYRAEAANPYGLKEGDYAGEIVNYTLNQKSESGVGLTPPVLEVLLKDYQTFEDIREKGEKIPLPFDPRNVEFEMGEIGYTMQVTLSDGTNAEMKRGYLGLDLPLGTTIFCPIGTSSRQVELVSYYTRSQQIFSSKEREAEFSEECLRKGFCEIYEYASSEGESKKVVYERPKTLKIQSKEKMALPFSIIFPWDSQVAQDIFVEIDKGPDREGGGPEKQVSLGDPLFILDSNKPAIQFVFASDYPIILEGRQAITEINSLFKIGDRYVFILPISK